MESCPHQGGLNGMLTPVQNLVFYSQFCDCTSTEDTPRTPGAAARTRTVASSSKRDLSIYCGGRATLATTKPVRAGFETFLSALCIGVLANTSVFRWKLVVDTSLCK